MRPQHWPAALLALLALVTLVTLGPVSCVPLPPPCQTSAQALGPCSPLVRLAYRLDPAFTSEERTAIFRAANLWEASSGGAVLIELDAPGEEMHRGGVDLPGMVGKTRGREIWLEPMALPGTFEATAAHELGHALGLKHSKDPQSIMYASVRPCARVSAGDLAALRAVLEK